MRRQPAGCLMQLRAENLGCHRGGREVFAGLNFAVGAGEALMVTGRNGAGKSSLLRLIAGLVRRSSRAARAVRGRGGYARSASRRIISATRTQ